MNNTWTSAEKKKEFDGIYSKLGVAVFNGVEEDVCSKYFNASCSYLINQFNQGNFSELERDNYLDTICNKFPCACILNSKKTSQ
jgi:hypothetical protein